MNTAPTKRTIHTIPTIGNEFTESKTQAIAMSSGMGSNKDLRILIRYDGYGNSIVRFVVTDHGKETAYEKYDAAAEAYNGLP